MDEINAQHSSIIQNDTHHMCFLCWNEFLQLTHLLSQSIQKDGVPEVIIGLQRGGLIPAVCLSHHLGVRPFFSLPVDRTTSDEIFAEKTAPSLIHTSSDLLREHVARKDVLLVDDIAGTGASVKAVLTLLKSLIPTRLRTCICVVNREHWDPHNAHAPAEIMTYVGKEVHGWVIFPWEMP